MQQLAVPISTTAMVAARLVGNVNAERSRYMLVCGSRLELHRGPASTYCSSLGRRNRLLSCFLAWRVNIACFVVAFLNIPVACFFFL